MAKKWIRVDRDDDDGRVTVTAAEGMTREEIEQGLFTVAMRLEWEIDGREVPDA